VLTKAAPLCTRVHRISVVRQILVVETGQVPEKRQYGAGMSRRQRTQGLSYYKWDSTDPTDLDEIESNVVAIDQLMEFELNGMTVTKSLRFRSAATATIATRVGDRDCRRA
jgi:hypothetical protein